MSIASDPLIDLLLDAALRKSIPVPNVQGHILVMLLLESYIEIIDETHTCISPRLTDKGKKLLLNLVQPQRATNENHQTTDF